MLVSVDADYKIQLDDEWLRLPNAVVRAGDILTVQIVEESRELKVA